VKLPQLDLPDGYTSGGLDQRRSLRQSLDEVARRFDRGPQMERPRSISSAGFFAAHVVGSPRSVRPGAGAGRIAVALWPLSLRAVLLDGPAAGGGGARFVQVNWSSHVEPVEDTGDGGWDMHDRNFQQLQDRHAWMLDQTLSALLDDLDQRGLLSDTIVIAVGEFGRTPKINERAGRDHWQQCYSAVVAGGGLKVGQVIGESDAKGEFPASRPVTPADLFCTALTQIGAGTTQLTAAGITPQGEVIEELV